MKNVSKISYFNKGSIELFKKVILCGVLLFVIGLVRIQAQTVTDIEGNVYNTVTLGSQVWMAGNLKTTKFNDNTSIPPVTDPATWTALTTPGYCWYNNDAGSYKATYGALYNWVAVNTGILCPTGWHVPTYDQWIVLTDYLTNNGYGYAGSGSDVAKSMASKSGWTTSTSAGSVGNDQASNNSSGFTALPGGNRGVDGVFQEISTGTFWWSSTPYSPTYAYLRYLYYDSFYYNWARNDMLAGYSVRCLKDLSTDITDPSTSIIEIYPNPVSGMLNIDYKNEYFETVSILNSQGALLKKEKAITPRQQIDFSKYPSGLYILEFIKSSGEINRVKVVKN
jgi:uncharacterized protein (TIGR02145 family)